ncbi:MAG: hypothetical protein ACLRY6_07565 [[Clostridium] innocuum]
MTEKSKRLKQLLKVIEDKEKDLTDNERMNLSKSKSSAYWNAKQTL